MFRKIFKLPETGPVANESYVGHFAPLVDRLAERIDPQVCAAMAKALTLMEDGTPCPAPHVSAGSTAVASLSVTLIARILNGDPVLEAPYMLVANMGTVSTEGAIKI